MMRKGWGALLLVLLLLNLAAVATAEDEVVTQQYPDSNYQPGPGWPPGWSPPPMPVLLESERNRLVDIMQSVPQYTRYETRVQDPLPRWTQEYPYVWGVDYVGCGSVLYLYWYPTPDTGLIASTYDRSFGGSKVSSDLCLFRPIMAVTEARKQTPEEIEADRRTMAYEAEFHRAHEGLLLEWGADDNGSPDMVYVYLNHGDASPKFDVPAYLDPTVGRVRVPIRFVSELMGASVNWDDAKGEVTIQFPEVSRQVLRVIPLDGYGYADLFYKAAYFPISRFYRIERPTITIAPKRIVLTVGRPQAIVNGQEVALDAPPVVKNGRTMVPIRFIAEQMGSKVYWVGDTSFYNGVEKKQHGTYQVHIFTPFFPLYEYPSWYLETYAVKF